MIFIMRDINTAVDQILLLLLAVKFASFYFHLLTFYALASTILLYSLSYRYF